MVLIDDDIEVIDEPMDSVAKMERAFQKLATDIPEQNQYLNKGNALFKVFREFLRVALEDQGTKL